MRETSPNIFSLLCSMCLLALVGDLAHAGAEPPVDAADLPALPLEVDEEDADRWALEEPFPWLRFNEPVDLRQPPHTDRWFYVVERRGEIWRFENDPDVIDVEPVLDLGGMVEAGGDNGLLGMAFHPDFGRSSDAEQNVFFVFYTTMIGGTQYYRLSRFELSPDAVAADRDSERVLIQQQNRDHLHNGGSLHFGPDGFLYFSVGDEGRQGDPFESTQKIDENLFSGVFRIDVDKRGGDVSHAPRQQPTRGATAGYYIPNDNPFVGVEGALAEFWALGFRSPHRMSFDSATGDLWLGDVGHADWERIERVRRGSNHGWSYREGFETYTRSYLEGEPPDPYPGVETWPVYVYPHADGNSCVIGGHVYRGQALPELEGWYVFGDLVSGRVWALEHDGERAVDIKLLATLERGAGANLAAFGVDHDGEIYLCTLNRGREGKGRIWCLARP